jgi:hypothetical protein
MMSAKRVRVAMAQWVRYQIALAECSKPQRTVAEQRAAMDRRSGQDRRRSNQQARRIA